MLQGKSWSASTPARLRSSLQAFDAAAESLLANLRDWSPALGEIGDGVLKPFAQRQFASQGGEGSAAWAPLAPATLRRKRGAGILIRTGRLLQSFQEGADHAESVADGKLTWGSTVPYAVFHQTGTGKGFGRTSVPAGRGTGRGMPMRPVISSGETLLRLAPQMRSQMRRIFAEHLARIAARSGFGTKRAK